jgi:hypothetical protein
MNRVTRKRLHRFFQTGITKQSSNTKQKSITAAKIVFKTDINTKTTREGRQKKKTRRVTQ